MAWAANDRWVLAWGGRVDGGPVANDGAVFDRRTNRWNVVGSDAKGRFGAEAVIAGDVAYIVGGVGGPAGDAPFSSVLTLGLSTPGMVRSPSAPTQLGEHPIVTWTGRHLVVAGGFEGDATTPVMTVSVYTPATRTWTQAPDLPWPAANGQPKWSWQSTGAATSTGRVVVARVEAPHAGDRHLRVTVRSLDPKTLRWTAERHLVLAASDDTQVTGPTLTAYGDDGMLLTVENPMLNLVRLDPHDQLKWSRRVAWNTCGVPPVVGTAHRLVFAVGLCSSIAFDSDGNSATIPPALSGVGSPRLISGSRQVLLIDLGEPAGQLNASPRLGRTVTLAR